MRNNTIRPPIVTVLGHVDHGKTSLLDYIRKSHVAVKEAGGITQGIGASMVGVPSPDGINKKITFIDTPGHAAFAKMRSRGAKACDLAVLVVDASDGVKPQTKEAISLINEAQIPFIVAVTKIDLPAADVEGVLGELAKEGIAFEGKGGNVPFLGISVKTGQGISELLETINLLWEVSKKKELFQDSLEAVVIENSKEGGGLLVSVVVQSGKLAVRETVYTEGLTAKIKGLFDFTGQSVKEIAVGEPGQILGFSALPPVGAIITAKEKPMTVSPIEGKKKDPYKKIAKDELIVIVKAENAGALEALLSSLPPKTIVVDSSVGDVLESDVLMARSTGARIFAFESAVSGSVRKLAEAEKVKVEKFDVIYELIDRISEVLKGGVVDILGKAEVIASFPFDNKMVAGCKVLQGRISKVSKLSLLRGEKELGKIKALSLKKGKQEVAEVKPGEEFGVLFTPQLDFQIGDVLVSVANGK